MKRKGDPSEFMAELHGLAPIGGPESWWPEESIPEAVRSLPPSSRDTALSLAVQNHHHAALKAMIGQGWPLTHDRSALWEVACVRDNVEALSLLDLAGVSQQDAAFLGGLAAFHGACQALEYLLATLQPTEGDKEAMMAEAVAGGRELAAEVLLRAGTPLPAPTADAMSRLVLNPGAVVVQFVTWWHSNGLPCSAISLHVLPTLIGRGDLEAAEQLIIYTGAMILDDSGLSLERALLHPGKTREKAVGYVLMRAASQAALRENHIEMVQAAHGGELAILAIAYRSQATKAAPIAGAQP